MTCSSQDLGGSPKQFPKPCMLQTSHGISSRFSIVCLDLTSAESSCRSPQGFLKIWTAREGTDAKKCLLSWLSSGQPALLPPGCSLILLFSLFLSASSHCKASLSLTLHFYFFKRTLPLLFVCFFQPETSRTWNLRRGEQPKT